MQIILPSTMTKKAIHPLGILRAGFGLWKTNFLILLGVYCLIEIPVILIATALPIIFAKSSAAYIVKGIPVLALIMGLLAGIWSSAALILTVCKPRENKPGGVISNIKEALRFFLPYLGMSIISTAFILLLVGVGIALLSGVTQLFSLLKTAQTVSAIILLILCIPVFLFIVYWVIALSLGGVSCVAEQKGPVRSVLRSYALIKNYIIPVAGVFLLVVAIFAPAWAPIFLVDKLGQDFMKENSAVVIFAQVYQVVLNMLFNMFWVSVGVVLFNKLKEAVDSDVHA
ncbi:MAG: hypothetical protein V1650_00095 [Candidatus Omnitrophota bacterium]